MAEEILWAGGESVGTRLHHSDKVADLPVGQEHVRSQDVQGCTQGADNIRGLLR